jgi:HPt (histidine-containing phosphotransfer) domain-containing protein
MKGVHVDQARWDDLVLSLGDAVVEIVETYLADTPIKIAEIRTAISDGDFDTASRVAHSIKSSSGIFGAPGLVGLCKALEQAAQDEQSDCLLRTETIHTAFQNLALELQSKVTLLKS